MISLAPFGNVVEQPSEIKHLRPFEFTDEPAAKRVFMGELRCLESAQVSHHHEDMFIHGIDVKQVVLHLADNPPEHRDITAQDAIAVHEAQLTREPARLTQDFHE